MFSTHLFSTHQSASDKASHDERGMASAKASQNRQGKGKLLLGGPVSRPHPAAAVSKGHKGQGCKGRYKLTGISEGRNTGSTRAAACQGSCYDRQAGERIMGSGGRAGGAPADPNERTDAQPGSC